MGERERERSATGLYTQTCTVCSKRKDCRGASQTGKDRCTGEGGIFGLGNAYRPVLKPDDSVRIFGDYKITINPALDVPEHPMPTADDLFTQLNGGKSLQSWTCPRRSSKCFFMKNRCNT